MPRQLIYRDREGDYWMFIASIETGWCWTGHGWEMAPCSWAEVDDAFGPLIIVGALPDEATECLPTVEGGSA